MLNEKSNYDLATIKEQVSLSIFLHHPGKKIIKLFHKIVPENRHKTSFSIIWNLSVNCIEHFLWGCCINYYLLLFLHISLISCPCSFTHSFSCYLVSLLLATEPVFLWEMCLLILSVCALGQADNLLLPLGMERWPRSDL